MSDMETSHLSVRIPSKLKMTLEQEAKAEKITVSELVKRKILIASAQNCTLSLNFDGLQIPVEKLTKGSFVLENTASNK